MVPFLGSQCRELQWRYHTIWMMSEINYCGNRRNFLIYTTIKKLKGLTFASSHLTLHIIKRGETSNCLKHAETWFMYTICQHLSLCWELPHIRRMQKGGIAAFRILAAILYRLVWLNISIMHKLLAKHVSRCAHCYAAHMLFWRAQDNSKGYCDGWMNGSKLTCFISRNEELALPCTLKPAVWKAKLKALLKTKAPPHKSWGGGCHPLGTAALAHHLLKSYPVWQQRMQIRFWSWLTFE